MDEITTNGEGDLIGNQKETAENLQKAMSHHQAGEIHLADQFYRKVLDADRDNVDMLHYYGLLQHQHGNKEQGLRMIEWAIHKDPKNLDALSNLGAIFLSDDKLEEASHVFKRCLDINPDSAATLINISTLEMKSGRIESAISWAQKAVGLEPDNAVGYTALSRLYSMRGDFHEAIEAYDRSLVLTKHLDAYTSESYFITRGNLMQLMNRKEEASELYREFYREHPDNPIAKHMHFALFTDESPEKPDDEYVKDTFDQFAESFDKMLENLKYQAPEIVGEAVTRHYAINDNSLRVLDAGCGTGLVAKHLKSYSQNLVGIDLSEKMLLKAQKLALYDDLQAVEIEQFLSQHRDSYDLIVAADTYCYFGKLNTLFNLLNKALISGGKTMFTVELLEESDSDGYKLDSSGRYKHTRSYVEQQIEQANLKLLEMEEVFLRMERSESVTGLLVVAER